MRKEDVSPERWERYLAKQRKAYAARVAADPSKRAEHAEICRSGKSRRRQELQEAAGIAGCIVPYTAKTYSIRKMAQREARATGEDLLMLYKRWGCVIAKDAKTFMPEGFKPRRRGRPARSPEQTTAPST